MLMLAVGTGIGAAFCLDGQVLRGAHAMAGEVGRLRVHPSTTASWSCRARARTRSRTTAAGPAILNAYLALGGNGSAAAWPGRGEAGRRAATRLADRGRTRCSGAGSAACSAGWCSVLDPEVVVLGGGVPSPSSVWWTELETQNCAPGCPTRSPRCPS